MNCVRFCITTALFSLACSCPGLSQEIATSETLPDAPSYTLQQAVSAPQSTISTPTGENGLSSVHGVVTDASGDVIPNARVALEAAGKLVPRVTLAATDGSFSFTGLPAGRYSLLISGSNLAAYGSGEFILKPAETFEVPRLALKFVTSSTVTVNATAKDIADEQIHEQEKQRVFGIVQNFYTSYIWDAAPMTTRQKYKLSAHTIVDPTTFLIVAGIAGAEHYHGTYPDYGPGIEGYGKRYGAALADAVTGRIMGSAVLPSLFHQDPRYFYQGSGSVSSRSWHALASAFVCRGDNGKNQPNYSHILGNLIAGGIANTYHPPASRGVGLTFQTLAITTGGSAIGNLFREFLLRRLSPSVPAFANGKKQPRRAHSAPAP